MKFRISVAALAALASQLVPIASKAAPDAQERSVDPVVLTGVQFPSWSAGPDPTVREPGNVTNDCPQEENPWVGNDPDHSCVHDSRLPRNPRVGAPVSQLRGYRWTGTGFTQIPFQVDERYTRYLSNDQSGFAFYSMVDEHNTYAFDREGFRFSSNDPDDVCSPRPREDPVGSGKRPAAMPDPVVGLDDDDELVFMHRDTGAQAPPGSGLPAGIVDAYEIGVADPSNPGTLGFVYVMQAAESGPAAAFTAENSPYVSYRRDAGPNRLGADLFVRSQSSYGDYGAAPKGPVCDPATGLPVLNEDGSYKIEQRRPIDTAWIMTPRYAFRYEGRWLMTELHVNGSAAGTGDFASLIEQPSAGEIDATYGPDIIDRWKARAFAQDPSSETPCCGYEEEDTNWGGSSILMGERAGPVRIIREAWGADSSTNNARREIFYRDLFVWGDSLRVHVIPPLDGIYSQWDYNAGRITKYYNATRTDGVDVDGKNDEVFGNLDDPCNSRYDGRNAPTDEQIRVLYRQAGLCDISPYHQSVDLTDPTMAGPQALHWEQASGPYGTLVLRTAIREHTAGGDVQSMLAVPYYRDDSCFDDGTGTDPGPRRRERSSTETDTYRLPGSDEDLARRCWTPTDGTPDASFTAGTDVRGLGDEVGDERFYQGAIGTSGIHLLFVAESDNAGLTKPVTEIVSEQRIVVLPGDPGHAVGETYGRSVEFPLRTAARPYA